MSDELRNGGPGDDFASGEDFADNAGLVSDEQIGLKEGERGVLITPRRLLIAVAVVLAIILALLLFYLLFMRGEGLSTRVTGGDVNGIQAERVILGPGSGSKEPVFARPMGAAWDPGGDYVYVADSEHNRICVFSRAGRFINEFGGLGVAKPLPGAKNTWKPGRLSYPVDVATDDEGRVYVADFYNDSISVFSANGEFVNRFPDPYKPVGKGSSGHEGQGIAVTAVTVHEGLVYATDTYQIFVFKLDGTLVRQFGRPGKEVGELDRPNGVAVLEDGTIVVSDSNNNRMQAFTPTGEPLWVLGERLPAGVQTPRDDVFVLPRGVTTMEEGSLLVADPLGQALVEFTDKGQEVQSYGRRGTLPSELSFPNDVDWHDGRILVADRENQRVQIVKIGRRGGVGSVSGRRTPLGALVTRQEPCSTLKR